MTVFEGDKIMFIFIVHTKIIKFHDLLLLFLSMWRDKDNKHTIYETTTKRYHVHS